jgi:uncharacterized Zn finger protein (UPF0148 family)
MRASNYLQTSSFPSLLPPTNTLKKIFPLTCNQATSLIRKSVCAKGVAMKITQIQCPSCLGQLTVDWETGKAVCQYCLTKSVLQSPPKQTQEASNEQAPVVFQKVKEGFYSFAFNEDEVANALKKWLIQQESVPEDIIVHLEVS